VLIILYTTSTTTTTKTTCTTAADRGQTLSLQNVVPIPYLLANADCFAPARQIPLDLRRRSGRRSRMSSFRQRYYKCSYRRHYHPVVYTIMMIMILCIVSLSSVMLLNLDSVTKTGNISVFSNISPYPS